jgi:hypothetical protein
MQRFPACVILFVILAIAVAPSDATAQDAAAPQWSHTEWWAAVSGVIAGPTGVIASSYSPPLLLDGEFTSRGGQTIVADTGFAVGFTGGVNVFPTRRVGFQILFDRASCDVSAASNTPYTVFLQYVSRQPPNDEMQIVSLTRSFAWPTASGALTQAAVAFNLAIRIGRSNRPNVTIAGGPAYYRTSGHVEPLGYTAFQLGGHSVLFEDDYRLRVSLSPVHKLGIDAGGDFNAPIGHHAALVVGYRYFGGSHPQAAVSGVTILNGDELTFQQPIADIAARLAPVKVRLSVTGSRLFVGVKITG